MHLVWENTIKNLVLLWTGSFKGLDEGTGSYHLSPSVWDAIGLATASSGSTIPSAYGARPPNIATDHTSTTADSWSFWTLYIGPVLLRRRFTDVKYYDHFIALVKLLHTCLGFSITTDCISELREGFTQWVLKFEELYYQYNPQRISACPVTIHALLHIADSIISCGPAWAYWAFPMERYCGLIRPGIKSRKHPFASLDRFVVECAQMVQIRLVYQLDSDPGFSLSKPRRPPSSGFRCPQYETTALLPPSRQNIRPDATILRKIEKCIATRYEMAGNIKAVKQCLAKAEISEWAKLRVDDGDTICATAFVSAEQDRRDATYARYEVLVDIHANRPRAKPVFKPETRYGRIQHIYSIEMPRCAALGIHTPETLFLAGITPCIVLASHSKLDIHYYREESKTEQFIDIDCVQCLVGRIKDHRGTWAIIDRSGALSRALYIPDA
ncbi:hypothetical protein BV25DRAFT_1817076 [Artomyces pyxidatus]|uniref:Uncharacterized protein n=1 Tax=Artomyces pyxidatus TaxID=48021 RepID=A0ACB8SDM6_9AGAM|nr:hypothetical protein BV25DRAFT_1817076 [Artomyces pyxidatus]